MCVCVSPRQFPNCHLISKIAVDSAGTKASRNFGRWLYDVYMVYRCYRWFFSRWLYEPLAGPVDVDVL